jgi:1-acyl-sn-glycerol-3-phosphate acyltransferase
MARKKANVESIQAGTDGSNPQTPAAESAPETTAQAVEPIQETVSKATGEPDAAVQPEVDSIPSAVKSAAEAAGKAVESTADAVSGSAEPEPSPEELRRQLADELDELVERLKALHPEYTPPPFSPERLRRLLGQGASSLASLTPGFARDMLDKVRQSQVGSYLDPEALKGLWYMLNYTASYQADVVKRRFTGDYQTDEWGYDSEVMDAVRPFLDFMYKIYWRVQTSGIENIPYDGRALLVVNHSGQLPWDGAMVAAALLNEHPSQRLTRTLYATWLPTLPFASALLVKLGQALATEENGVRLLEQDQLVAVYPEGYKGVGKLFKDRYQLARFGRGGFIRMALKTGSPIIPAAVVGAEETYVSLYKSKTIARMINFPYFPISLTWPWLGPLGFVPMPTKWYIDFGQPIPMDGYGPGAEDNYNLVSELTDQVRNVVQEMVFARLAQRKSVFFG